MAQSATPHSSSQRHAVMHNDRLRRRALSGPVNSARPLLYPLLATPRHPKHLPRKPPLRICRSGRPVQAGVDRDRRVRECIANGECKMGHPHSAACRISSAQRGAQLGHHCFRGSPLPSHSRTRALHADIFALPPTIHLAHVGRC